MKIITIENLFSDKEPYITLRPDNAVLRNNDDFYLPPFSDDIVCGCGIIVRITRLAKCIPAKFAHRCYDSLTAGVAFVARDIMQKALSEGRPCDEAYSFDRSIAVGTEWIEPQQLGQGIVKMNIGQSEQQFCVENLRVSIDECLSRATQHLTLKTGDLLFIAMPTDIQVVANSNVTVTLNDTTPLDFSIK